VFYRLRLIEAYGTGIPKIMRCYANCAKKPELQATNNAFKIILPNKNIPHNRTAGLAAHLTENEDEIIALFDRQPEITRNDVEAALHISQAMAVRLLRRLIDKGAIQVIGGGKKTRYRKIVLHP